MIRKIHTLSENVKNVLNSRVSNGLLPFSSRIISRIPLRFSLLATVIMLISLIGFFSPTLLANRSAATVSGKATYQSDGNTHTLAASHYSVKDEQRTMLMISNQGPNQMPVQVRLFSQYGHQLDLPAMVLNGHELKSVDLGQYALPWTSFEEGNVQIEYQGRKMELGGAVVTTDKGQKLLFDEELVEPAREFASSQLEGVWWRPDSNAEVYLALSNTGNSPLSVAVTTSGAVLENPASQRVDLAAHETRVLSTKKSEESEKLKLSGTAGGITVNHSGTPGALIAYGYVQELTTGFSTVIDFSDPKKATTARLDGAGLRVNPIANQALSQIALVRNIGETPTTIRVRVPYTLSDRSRGVAILKELPLYSGEVRLINLRPVILQTTQGKSVTSAGLELTYKGKPGSVIASALSISADRNHVFRVPMRDATIQSSSTGIYPWSIDDNSSSFVYIKNVTKSPKQFTMMMSFDGGNYMLGDLRVLAGQTAVYDIRSLRDSQKPDVNGHVIPISAFRGKIHWSLRDSEAKSLIGRVEQVDTANGVSMTVACGLCCNDSFYDAWITPDTAVGLIGDTSQFSLFRVDKDCFGFIKDPVQSFNSNWSCDNTSVATINSQTGLAAAAGLGNSLIRNSFYATVYTDEGSFCSEETSLRDPTALCDVVDPQACPIPRNFRQDGQAQTQNKDMIINYKWDSSTGNLANLSNVTIGERVDYPARNCGGASFKYCWPSPPWANTTVTDQPTVINLPNASSGSFFDTHESKSFVTPYQAKDFVAKQVYRYKTPCAANNAWVELVKYEIKREVINQSGWKYKITKGSNVKTFNLP